VGCPGVVSGEVTATGATFDILQQSNNNALLASELLIAAVPNTATGTVTAPSVGAMANEHGPLSKFPAVTSVDTVSPDQTPNAYGNVNPPLLKEATLTSAGNVFTILGPPLVLSK
jgi:hypothetical protein